jgi:hypothetical protein
MATQVSPQQQTSRVWLALLAGPLTWAAYFIIGYLLIETVCKSDFLNFSLFGFSAVSVIILSLTLVGVAITLYAGFSNYRKWKQSPREETLDFGQDLENKPWRFMALSGLLLSGLFTLLILLTGVSVFILRPC